MVIEQCNPDWFSVPLVGYRFYEAVAKFAEVTLVTHARNREALLRKHRYREIHFIEESTMVAQWHIYADKISKVRGNIIWPIYLTLSYPVYAAFNRDVYRKFHQLIKQGEYDLVHSITPMVPRFPVKLVKACDSTPFIIGPVNGGVPYPDGFREVAKKEFSYLNFLRKLGRLLLPGYRATYQKAAYILSGSSYTLKMIQDLFNIPSQSIELFFENGIESQFLRQEPKESYPEKIKLLFVGRLVPYKGADMLVEAIYRLPEELKQCCEVIVVGDGSERQVLEVMVDQFELREIVKFIGWVDQADTLGYYQAADVFCFPSVREFGGAVVLEAMANRLPCVVVNNGGIGEYVTDETGFRIEPTSREYVIDVLTKHIAQLVENKELRERMSAAAFERAKSFTWEEKSKNIEAIYNKVLS